MPSCRLTRVITAASAFAVVFSLWSANDKPANAASFTPHRAVYDMTLDKSRSNGVVSRAQGKLEFEWADVCAGWMVSQKTRIQVSYGDGRTVDFGWSINSLEAKNGQRYQFFIRRFFGDGESESVRGKAQLDGPGGPGLATYSVPEEKEIMLPKGTIFPTEHTLLLMDAAERGEKNFWRIMFDGSGDEGLSGVNVAISEQIPAGKAGEFKSPLLDDVESWRMDLAFFSMDKSNSEPEHEQTLRLFANGVVDELLLDYGDFVLKATLKQLEKLPVPNC